MVDKRIPVICVHALHHAFAFAREPSFMQTSFLRHPESMPQYNGESKKVVTGHGLI